jgi:hypothetical protein
MLAAVVKRVDESKALAAGEGLYKRRQNIPNGMRCQQKSQQASTQSRYGLVKVSEPAMFLLHIAEKHEYNPTRLLLVGPLALRPMKKKDTTTLSVREVSHRLSAPLSTVRLWAQQGRFAGAELKETPAGSYWSIPESSLDQFERPERGRPAKARNSGSKRSGRQAQRSA